MAGRRVWNLVLEICNFLLQHSPYLLKLIINGAMLIVYETNKILLTTHYNLLTKRQNIPAQ